MEKFRSIVNERTQVIDQNQVTQAQLQILNGEVKTKMVDLSHDAKARHSKVIIPPAEAIDVKNNSFSDEEEDNPDKIEMKKKAAMTLNKLMGNQRDHNNSTNEDKKGENSRNRINAAPGVGIQYQQSLYNSENNVKKGSQRNGNENFMINNIPSIKYSGNNDFDGEDDVNLLNNNNNNVKVDSLQYQNEQGNNESSKGWGTVGADTKNPENFRSSKQLETPLRQSDSQKKEMFGTGDDRSKKRGDNGNTPGGNVNSNSNLLMNSNINYQKVVQVHKSNFLQSLSQNRNLGNGISYEETIQDQKIKVNLKTNDLISFVRIQHEMDELKRRNQQHKDKKVLISEQNVPIDPLAKEQIKLIELEKKTEKQKESSFQSFINSFVGTIYAQQFVKQLKERKEENSSLNQIQSLNTIRELEPTGQNMHEIPGIQEPTKKIENDDDANEFDNVFKGDQFHKKIDEQDQNMEQIEQSNDEDEDDQDEEEYDSEQDEEQEEGAQEEEVSEQSGGKQITQQQVNQSEIEEVDQQDGEEEEEDGNDNDQNQEQEQLQSEKSKTKILNNNKEKASQEEQDDDSIDQLQQDKNPMKSSSGSVEISSNKSKNLNTQEINITKSDRSDSLNSKQN